MMLLRVLLLVIWVNPVFALTSKSPDIFDLGARYFQTVGDEESIPLGVITALAQDTSGFLWIGTQKGLVRYDGYEFRLFAYNKNDPESIAGNFISVLWASPNGQLWIGTRHDGLSVYNPDSDSFIRFQNREDDPHSLADNYITAIQGDSADNIWVGTKRGGLNRLNRYSGEFTRFSSSPNTESQPDVFSSSNTLQNDHITSLLLDEIGTLWIGTEDGLEKLEKGSTSIQRIYSQPENSTSLAGLTINKIFKASNGYMWLAINEFGAAWINNGQLHLIKSVEKQQDKLSNPMIVDIAQPVKNEIWLASYGGGIDIVDAENGDVMTHIMHDVSIQSSLNLNNIGAMLLDRSGMLWVGTWGNGLNYYNPHNTAFRMLRHSPTNPNSISYPDILSILEIDDRDIWIGTRGNGIDVLRPGVGLASEFRVDPANEHGLKDGSITALLQTRNGTIWVGSRQTGLYRYRPQSNDFQRYDKSTGLSNNVIKRIIEDQSGNLWIGTEKGLDHLNPVSGEIYSLTTKDAASDVLDSFVNVIALMEDGTLYVGASDGLYRLQKGGKFLDKYQHENSRKNSLSHNQILGLFIDDQQHLWVATAQGLDKLVGWENAEPIFESINNRVGYADQPLWANLMQDPSGRIWDGQSIIDLQNNTRRMLTKADGVDIGVNWYAAYSKTHNGTLLYAGSTGVLMIKPENFHEWNFQPPLVITELIVNGESRAVGNLTQFQLAATKKNFSVKFSALDFSEPDKNQYAYKLVGYDEDWHYINSQNRVASYTNLDPASYRLQIKGTNRLGKWSDKVINLSIEVLPGWYQTIWFKLLFLVIISGLLYLIYYFRIRQLHRYKDSLELQVGQQTEALKKSNRSVRALSDIGLEISTSIDLDKILNTIYQHVNEVMDANVFCIGFYEEEHQQIVFKLAIEKGKHLPLFIVSMKEENRLPVWCIKNRKPVIINDFERDRPKYLGSQPSTKPMAGAETASVIYWPLEVAGRIIGTITVQSFESNAYTLHHQDIIKTLASTTAIVMDNANAYAKAQRAAEIKSIFMANMSHEIRTPMNGILGMTRLIKETKLNGRQKVYVNNIDISANTLLTIVNDILDFSKIEAGKMSLEKNPFSVSALLANVSAVVNSLAKEKRLKFNFEIAEEVPGDLVGDVTRLNQILLNLCSNAIKFTERGEIRLLVGATKIQENDCYLEIKVIDQGIGIPEDIMPQLFDAFSQADVSTTRRFGGTGLGLAICSKLAKKMRGDISVESVVGEGSCFTLRLVLPMLDFQKLGSEFVLKSPCDILLVAAPEELDELYGLLAPLKANLYGISNLDELDKLVKNIGSLHAALVCADNGIRSTKEALSTLNSKIKLSEKNIIIYSKNKREKILKRLDNFEPSRVIQKPLSIYEIHKNISYIQQQVRVSSDFEKNNNFKDIRILVAEDNEINQLIARRILTGLGAKVDVVSNGEDAVINVLENNYDVVLMDIQMPKLDGLQATAKIRDDSRYNKLPIIAMTANVLQSDIEYHLANGMSDHVSKPIDKEQLITKITYQVERYRSFLNGE